MSESSSQATEGVKISLRHLLSEKDGRWDWNTLGNILTGHVMGEVLKASHLDVKYGTKQRDSRVATDWEFVYEEKDVVVLKKRLEKSPIMCFMGRGIIDHPLNEIANLVGREKSASIWDKFVVDVRCVELLTETDTMREAIAYVCYESSRCLVKARRDFLVYLRGAYVDDKYVMATISVDHPDCPTVHGTVRAESYAGSGWVLEPYEGSKSRTLVSRIVNIDLKGPIPPILMNRVLKREPLAIHYLRQHLMKTKQTGDEGGGRSATLSTEKDPKRRGHSMSLSSTYQHHHPASALAFTEHFEDTIPVGAFMGPQQQLDAYPGHRRRPSKESTPAAPLATEAKDRTAEQWAKKVSCSRFESGSPLGHDSVGNDEAHINPLPNVTGSGPNLKRPVEDEPSGALFEDSTSTEDCSYYTCAEFDASGSS